MDDFPLFYLHLPPDPIFVFHLLLCEICISNQPILSITIACLPDLQECGKITSDGVSFLFNCIAIEDFLLRHNVSVQLVLIFQTRLFFFI